MSEPFGNGDGDVVLQRDPKTTRARRYCVVFYNDDYTTKWFVVHVLEDRDPIRRRRATRAAQPSARP